ncbi:phosphopantetheine-binding protein [Streptomyces sp. NPDC001127]|uniref:phosphopantetheine-binding protein n=1 Tax=Streptomyces sp. NPDC001127 TaxID=3154377 RepID=UPI0033237398
MTTTSRPQDLAQLKKLIRAAWENHLGHGEFANDEPFLTIGGNSLTAIRLVTSLNAELGLHLKVRTLFQNQTVDSFTAAVAEYITPSTSTN